MDEVLQGRFRIVEELGRGSQATTFLGEDRVSGARVAIKELDLDFAVDWKAIDLFRREGRVLQNLRHPGIPAYVDAFHIDDGPVQRFFLVQEFVEGENFQELMERGLSFTDEEARGFLDAILEILEYLHGRSPPVIHRDIKPSNIIRRPDGSPALIDFGAVQEALPDERGGSTIVGTTGYMPPEQLMGRTVASTDLYALGATAVHLLSRVRPMDLPVRNMRMQFRDRVQISPGLMRILERMVEPDVERRYRSAQEVRRDLQRLGAGGPALSHGDQVPVELTPGPNRTSGGSQALPAMLAVLGMVVVMGMAGVMFFVVGADEHGTPPPPESVDTAGTVTCSSGLSLTDDAMDIPRLVARDGCDLNLRGGTIDILEYEPGTKLTIHNTRFGEIQGVGSGASLAEINMIGVQVSRGVRFRNTKLRAEDLQSPVIEMETTDGWINQVNARRLSIRDGETTFTQAMIGVVDIGPGGSVTMMSGRGGTFDEVVMEGEAANQARATLETSVIQRADLGAHSSLALGGSIQERLNLDDGATLILQRGSGLFIEEFTGTPGAVIELQPGVQIRDREILSAVTLRQDGVVE